MSSTVPAVLLDIRDWVPRRRHVARRPSPLPRALYVHTSRHTVVRSRVIASYKVPSYPGQWNVSRGSYSTSASLGLHAFSAAGRGLASQPSRAQLASTTIYLRHYGPIVGVVTRALCGLMQQRSFGVRRFDASRHERLVACAMRRVATQTVTLRPVWNIYRMQTHVHRTYGCVLYVRGTCSGEPFSQRGESEFVSPLLRKACLARF